MFNGKAREQLVSIPIKMDVYQQLSLEDFKAHRLTFLLKEKHWGEKNTHICIFHFKVALPKKDILQMC